MASSKCIVETCKRSSDTLCSHCQEYVCTKHYIEHVKLANDRLIAISDELNSLVDKLQQNDLSQHVFQQLEENRTENHRQIDVIYDDRKQQLQNEIDQKKENCLKNLGALGRVLNELIDEGDASFKQIGNIMTKIELCRQQYKQFETLDYNNLNSKGSNFKIKLFNEELFKGDGTLLSFEQQLKLNEFYGKQGQKWILIYKATRDGFSGSDFHRCCDQQGPTLTVVQSGETGYLFGGYTSISWKASDTYRNDPNNPFLFSLTNPHGLPPTKYPVKASNYAIFPQANCGPVFGGGYDLYICAYSQTNRNSFFRFPHSYQDTTHQGTLTFTGNEHFQTNEIEVYRLIET